MLTSPTDISCAVNACSSAAGDNDGEGSHVEGIAAVPEVRMTGKRAQRENGPGRSGPAQPSAVMNLFACCQTVLAPSTPPPSHLQQYNQLPIARTSATTWRPCSLPLAAIKPANTAGTETQSRRRSALHLAHLLQPSLLRPHEDTQLRFSHIQIRDQIQELKRHTS